MNFVIKVGSVTSAQRGMKLLRSKGFRPTLGRIEKPQPSDGCGYAIRLNADSGEKAVSLLEKAGITVLGVESK